MRVPTLAGLVVVLSLACSGGGKGGSGGQACTPGAQVACACPGGVQGAQACNVDGSGYDACQCVPGNGGSGGSGGSGAGGSGGTGGTGGSGGTGGTGGTGVCPIYAGLVPDVPSIWSSSGLIGLAAGNDMCQKAAFQGDHACDYEEVLKARDADQLSGIAQGTTAWVQRTTAAMVNGQSSAPGPGGNCNNWTYGTNHIGDGEYATFDTQGVPTFHLDNDTVFDPSSPGMHTIPNDLQCGGVTRAILCCFAPCK